jgi:transposase
MIKFTFESRMNQKRTKDAIEMHSTRERLSIYSQRIKKNLLSSVEETIGPLTSKQQQLLTTLEVIRIEDFILPHVGVGRPPDDRVPMARAFVAKAIYGHVTTRQLLDQLQSDIRLRRICGWEKAQDVPEEWSFSRAFAEFAVKELPTKVHEALIAEFQSERLVGHISRDSTAIDAREKAKKRPQEPKVDKSKRKRGRPKKGEERESVVVEPKRLEKQQSMSLTEMLADLPKECDVGAKKNAKGYLICWKGYKLHIDTADGQIPISCVLTSASLHDSQVALPLAVMSNQRVINLYDLMDAAYDSEIIREHSKQLGHVPLIDYNRRSPKDERRFDPHEAQRYKERSTAERVNARLKDEFGGLSVRVRGHRKVMAHLMFGILALTVDQLMRFAT